MQRTHSQVRARSHNYHSLSVIGNKVEKVYAKNEAVYNMQLVYYLELASGAFPNLR
ncbi:hypothetical protein GGER_02560 [Serratia rubidaea]